MNEHEMFVQKVKTGSGALNCQVKTVNARNNFLSKLREKIPTSTPETRVAMDGDSTISLSSVQVFNRITFT